MKKGFIPPHRLNFLFGQHTSPHLDARSKSDKRVLELTKAVRMHTGGLALYEGYTMARCEDPTCIGTNLLISASRENIIDLLALCMEHMGEDLHPFFSQNPDTKEEGVYWKPIVDRVIVESAFRDFEDVLLDDGKAVFCLDSMADDNMGSRLHFAADKIINVHGLPEHINPLEIALRQEGLRYRRPLETIRNRGFDLETTPELQDRFILLKNSLAMFDKDEQADPEDYQAGSNA